MSEINIFSVLKNEWDKDNEGILTITQKIGKWWNPFSWGKTIKIHFPCKNIRMDSGQILTSLSETEGEGEMETAIAGKVTQTICGVPAMIVNSKEYEKRFGGIF
jgi:hypothetical protein